MQQVKWLKCIECKFNKGFCENVNSDYFDTDFQKAISCKYGRPIKRVKAKKQEEDKYIGTLTNDNDFKIVEQKEPIIQETQVKQEKQKKQAKHAKKEESAAVSDIQESIEIYIIFYDGRVLDTNGDGKHIFYKTEYGAKSFIKKQPEAKRKKYECKKVKIEKIRWWKK